MLLNIAAAPLVARAIDVSGVNIDGATLGQRIVAQVKKVNEIDPREIPFVRLDSGVQYAEYRPGSGEAVAALGKRIAVKCTVRLPALATKDEIGGPQVYNTKYTDIQELNWRMGDGTVVPGLEKGVEGMKLGALRRVVVPDAYFTNKSGEKLRKNLEPQPNGDKGRRAFDAVVNNPRRDQTAVFEVELIRLR
jgi:hypothetical protein